MTTNQPDKFPAPGTFSPEELTIWLDSLDLYTLIAILEKIYKDVRDYAIQQYRSALEEAERGDDGKES